MVYLFYFAISDGHMRLIVPILILLVSFSLAEDGLPSLLSFLLLFGIKILSSQFLLLFQSFILYPPPHLYFCLNISKDDHGGMVRWSHFRH